MNNNYKWLWRTRGRSRATGIEGRSSGTSPSFIKSLWCLFAMLLFGVVGQAQTTVISGTGAGSFEGGSFAADGWNTLSDPTKNQFFIGDATKLGAAAPHGTNGVYLSANSGATRGYAHTTAYNWIFKDVTIPAGETTATLTMDMLGNPGDEGFDGILVGATDTSTMVSLSFTGSGTFETTFGATAFSPFASIGVTATATSLTTGNTSLEDGSYTTFTTRTFTFNFIGNPNSSTTRRIWIGWKCDGSVGNTTTPYSLDKVNMVTSQPLSLNASAFGGLWSSPATWANGVVPVSGSDVTIPAGAVVTIDQAISMRNITVNGTLQYNGTANAVTTFGNFNISSTGKFYAYTSSKGAITFNAGGDFINDGYTNFGLSTLSLRGSLTSGSSSQTLGGAGIFEGGSIKNLSFETTGACTISTTQNLFTHNLIHRAGSLNTGGKLTVDNTKQIFGSEINNQVSNVVVTTMGVHANAPAVFGGTTAPTLWVSGANAGIIGSRVFSGNNVYIVTAGNGTAYSTTAPTHTSGSASNGATATLLWAGTLGTIGTPFAASPLTVGQQVFFGNNLYTCVVAGTPSLANPPIHTSGAALSGSTCSLLYVGSPATATVNYDATTFTARSVSITNPGSGYNGNASPALVFVPTGAVTTTGTIVSVVHQSIAPNTSASFQKGPTASISGGLNINNDQNAAQFSGVGSVTTSSTSYNYTSVPTIGFSGPTGINLVTDGGSGYTAAPTVITVTGGTLIPGVTQGYVSGDFAIASSQGKVVSVYLTSTIAKYSVLPTLQISGNATIAFPAGCLPTATAVLSATTAGQIANINVTNPGFGYITAPSVALTAATTGTPTLTAALAIYNLTYNTTAPSSEGVVTEGAEIPTNRKLNSLTVSNTSGATFTGDLRLLASSSALSMSGQLNFGTNTLHFDSPFNAGTTGTSSAFVNGKIRLNSTGRVSDTRTFPFINNLVLVTGTGANFSTGSTSTQFTASLAGTPTGTVTPSGSMTGIRTYRIQNGVGEAYSSSATVTLNYNATDVIISDNPSLFVAQATATSGPWTVRSIAGAAGILPATGSRTTSTTLGSLSMTGDDYFGWSSTLESYQSAQTGNWNDGTTWVGGNIPPTATCADVFIMPGHNVSVTSTGAIAKNVTVTTGGTLTVAAGDLIVGCTNNNNIFTLNGTLAVTGGTLNINGNLNAVAGSTLTQSGGDINVDGNNAGVVASSVGLSTTPLVGIATSNLNLSGGTLTVVDPHAVAGTSAFAFSYTGPLTVNTTTGWTLRFGNGVSTTPGAQTPTASAAGGFILNTGTPKLYYDKIVVNGGLGTNRMLTNNFTTYGVKDLIINTDSELWMSTSAIHIGGDLVNNGTYTRLAATLNFQDFKSGVASPSLIPQSISGIGLFKNSILAASSTGNLVTVVVNNTSASGLTLNVPITISNSITLTNGVITTTDTNLLTIGGVSATGATITVSTPTAYVNGPLARFIPTGNTAFVAFPVGKSVRNQIDLRPTTTTASVFKAEAFDTNTGTIDANITALASKRWKASVVSGTFTDMNVKLTDASVIATNIPVQAPADQGVYTNSFGAVATVTGTTITSTQAITSANFTGFLSYAISNQCMGTPTPGNTVASVNPVCLNNPVNLSLQNVTSGTGVTYQWQSSSDGSSFTNVASATGSTFTALPNAVTYYRCIVTCVPGATSATSNPVQITFSKAVSSTTAATRCGTGPVTISATGTGNTVNWFSDLTSNTPISSGTSFSPTVTTSTTFYASSAEVGVLQNGTVGSGTATSSVDAVTPFTSNWETARIQYLVLASELTAAGFGAGNIKDMSFNITSAGGQSPEDTQKNYTIKMGATNLTALSNSFVTPTNGFTTVYGPVDESLQVVGTKTMTFGTSYIWDGVSNIIIDICHANDTTANTCVSCFGANSGVSVSTTSFNSRVGRNTDNNDFCGVDSTALTASTLRPNMTFSIQAVCASPKVPVQVTVTTPPTLTLSSSSFTICNGDVTSVVSVTAGAGDYANYTWSSGANETGSVATGWTLAPTVSGTYTLTAEQVSPTGECVALANVQVTVNPLPANFAITPAGPVAICVDQIRELKSNFVNIVSVGTQTGTTNIATPYRGNWGAQKTQFIYTAAELTAIGMVAGKKIESIGFKITSGTTTTFTNFEVKAGLTTSASSTTFINDATNIVFSNAAYVPSTTNGGEDYKLATPIVWDGTSNLVVQTCFNNNNGGAPAPTDMFVESSTVTAGLSIIRNNDNNSTVCTAPAAPTAQTIRPNLRLGVLFDNLVWSPTTHLWSDAQATVPYVATQSASSVFIKSSVAVQNAITYTATVTNQFGCTKSATTEITVEGNSVNFSFTQPDPVCAPATVAIPVPADNLQYSFFSNASATTVLTNPGSVSQTGTYYIKGTDTNGCFKVKEVFVVVNQAPALTLSSTSTTICQGTPSTAISLTSNVADYDTYTWSANANATGSATTGWTLNPTVSTVVTLQASQSAGLLCGKSIDVNVTVNALPQVFSITSTGSTACVNQPLKLEIPSIFLDSKIGTGTTTSTTVTPWRGNFGGQRNQYIYKAAELTALGITAGMTIDKIGFVIVSGTPVTFKDFEIKAGLTSTTSNSTFLPNATTIVFSDPLFTPIASGNQDFTLSNPIVWDGVSNLIVQTCFNNLTFTATTTNMGVECSTVTNDLSIRFDDDNIIDLCNKQDFITASTLRPNLRVSASLVTNASWSPITNLFLNVAGTIPYTATAVSSEVYVIATAPTTVTYTATATNNFGCTRSATAFVNVTDAVFTVATPAAVCAPETVSLTGGSNSALTYSFFTDAAAMMALANPGAITQTGTYYVKGTNANGCSTVVAVSATINPAANFTVTAPAAVCAPATISLPAGSDTSLTYSYFTDASATSVVTTPAAVTQSGTYYVKGSATAGCSLVVPVTVTINPAANFTVTAPAAVCAPATVSLPTGSDTSLTYTYFTDASASNVVSTPAAVTQSGTYYVKGTTTAGCSLVVPVSVTINPAANFTVTAPAAVCAPATVALPQGSDATLTYTYFSDANATIPVTTPSAINTSGTYYVKGTTTAGCSMVVPVVVTVGGSTAPTAAATQTFCGAANMTNLVATGTNVKWYDAVTGGNYLPTITTIGLVNGQTYYASQTVNGCESVSRTAVLVVITSTPIITTQPTASVSLCTGQSLNLTVATNPSTGNSYQWYKDGVAISGATTANYSIATPVVADSGVYTVVVTNSCGTVTSTGSTVDTSCLSNDEIEYTKVSLVIYPNPTSNVLNFKSNYNVSNVKIFSITGQLIRDENVESNKIDVSILEEATYLVKVTLENGYQTTERFVKRN